MSNVMPINGFHTVGMIKDTSSVTLPAAGLSDAVNVRFRNGGVEKASGSMQVVTNAQLTPLLDNAEITYLAVWRNPNVISQNNVYYVVVVTSTNVDSLYLINAHTKSYSSLNYQTTTGGKWQHTEFQGGYGLVMNNGLSRPVYLLDTAGNSVSSDIEAYELPGWDSYNTKITKINDTYDADIHIPDFDVGEVIDFTKFELLVDVIDSSTGARKFRQTITSEGTKQQVTVTLDKATNSHLVSIALAAGGVGQDAFTEFLTDGNQVIMSIRSINTTQVTAGVIKAWGDKLVAGNLKEIDMPRAIAADDTGSREITFARDHNFVVGDKILLTQPVKRLYTIGAIPASDKVQVTAQIPPGEDYSVIRYTVASAKKGIRDLPGVVRISDVAAPGSIPNNWNPYAQGVSTAEEFQLASTGEIKDMGEMQGQLYIYTNSSIHQLSETGSPITPYIATDITYSFGALCEGAVLEFNGVHIVVGSNDVYQFSGHPASIKSLAKNRVQDYLYDDLDFTELNVKLLFNQQENEVWLCYKKRDRVDAEKFTDILVWNYAHDAWSEFNSHAFNTVCMGPTIGWDGTSELPDINTSIDRPVLSNGDKVYGADFRGKFTTQAGGTYESWISRVEAPMTPEFDVESLASTALWVEKHKHSDPDLDLTLSVRGTNALNEMFVPDRKDFTPGPTNVTFTVGSDYKVDTRVTGRFLSYLITDKGIHSKGWNLSGLQFMISKGGRR